MSQGSDRLKHLRHALNGLILISIVLVTLPMIVSAIIEISNDSAIDPYTNQPVSSESSIRQKCLLDGAKLIEAVESKSISKSEFEEGFSHLEPCRSLQPKVYASVREAGSTLE